VGGVEQPTRGTQRRCPVGDLERAGQKVGAADDPQRRVTCIDDLSEVRRHVGLPVERLEAPGLRTDAQDRGESTAVMRHGSSPLARLASRTAR
jgi:hypothetical protein